MIFASTDSGLYTRTAVARLTLALAKLSCFVVVMHIINIQNVTKQTVSAGLFVMLTLSSWMCELV